MMHVLTYKTRRISYYLIVLLKYFECIYTVNEHYNIFWIAYSICEKNASKVKAAKKLHGINHTSMRPSEFCI